MKRVYFNHIPWNIHPVYQEMLDNPPEWVEYINKNEFWKDYQNTAIINDINKNLLIKIKKYIILFLKKVYILPNITFKKLSWDIIYSCQSIPLFWKYILDIDCYETLNRFSNIISENFINKLIVKHFVKQKRCKQVVFWSEAAKKSFQSYLGHEFDNKLTVLYPWINVKYAFNELASFKTKDNVIRIISIWKDFIYKSIEEILVAAELILLKYSNVEFIIIGQVPLYIKEKYSNKNIIFTWLIRREDVIDYLLKWNIFLLPTFIDIFWFSYIEAFSYWLACIWWEWYATNEIISDKVDWFIINWYEEKLFNIVNYKKNWKNINNILKNIKLSEKERIISDIFKNLVLFLDNNQLINKMTKEWYKKVNWWIFSVKYRNSILYELYNK